MATETVTLARHRVGLAQSALEEMEAVTRLLQQFIADNDTCGDVVYVSRGMIARLQKLGDAIGHCVEDRDEERCSDAELFEVIKCCKQPKANTKEVFHG